MITFLDKLASSGLTAADAKQLGLETLTPTGLVKLLPSAPKVPAFRIPYHDKHGQLRSDVYRVRLLDQPVGDLGQVSPLRYLQPSSSPVAAYFPRLLDWGAVLEDPARPLIITEGELKAACATKYGFPTIGLGGVSSWRSAKRGWGFLPELERVEWTQRHVWVCYDSDAASNPQVAWEAALLTKALTHRGALPYLVSLPALGDAKTGLDDFLVARGPEALKQVLVSADAGDLAQQLWRLNARYALITSPCVVYDEEQHLKLRPADFKGTLLANLWATRVVPNGDRPKVQQVQVAAEWIRWPRRRQYDGFTYAPGQPRVIDRQLNGWRGWGCEERPGSVKLWKQLLNRLFHGASPAVRSWFESWCAYPLRYPGTKLASACGVWSYDQGQGKSLVGVTLGKLYGPTNYIAISQRELESDFNDWLEHKQLVMVDDLSHHDSRAKADILKKLITQREAVINAKYISTYTLPDHANYYLTSNQPDALYLEDKDRRFFVHEVTVTKLDDRFYARYFKWLEEEGGAEALLHHLRHELSLDGFHPHAPPPVTAAKRDMQLAVKGELGTWLVELAENPDAKLRLGRRALKRDLYTTSELLALFDQTRRGRPVSEPRMGLALKEHFAPAGLLRVGERVGRYYVVRNTAKWRRAGRRALVEHLTKCYAEEG